MTDEKELGELIERARAAGAIVNVTYVESDGRKLVESVRVHGLSGVGPYAMSPLSAAERLREALGKKQPGGLLCTVFRAAGRGDSSTEGVTSVVGQVILVGDGIPEIFTPSANTPRVFFQKKRIGGEDYLYAAPCLGAVGAMMAGGNFIYTPDSRFPSHYPISVHDRME